MFVFIAKQERRLTLNIFECEELVEARRFGVNIRISVANKPIEREPPIALIVVLPQDGDDLPV